MLDSCKISKLLHQNADFVCFLMRALASLSKNIKTHTHSLVLIPLQYFLSFDKKLSSTRMANNHGIVNRLYLRLENNSYRTISYYSLLAT